MNTDLQEHKPALAGELVNWMHAITDQRIGAEAFENAKRNSAHKHLGKSIVELPEAMKDTADHAIIIAAGPSIKRQDTAKRLLDANYQGTIIATDSSLYYLLRHDIVPDLVVTLDPHHSRIVRWFGDPELSHEKIEADDYFSRQDMDEKFANELVANAEIIELLAHYGPRIKLALSTSASPAVVGRAQDTGMQIFWWNPMLDEPDNTDSYSIQMARMNGFPLVNAGGNVGAGSWMIADAILEKKTIALTGMDYSYYDGTPYYRTQYYDAAVDIFGAHKLDDFFIRVFNPFTQTWFFTDPAYKWYQQVFLEMLQDQDAQTLNCTEGGILFGDELPFIPLQEFFDKVNNGQSIIC